MKAPENPMGEIPQDQGFHKFHQRLSAYQALRGRRPFWLRPEDADKVSKMIDLMPHPDLDIHDLAK